MAVEFSIGLEHKPGALARVGDVLAKANVNINAIQGSTCEGQGIIQFVTNNVNRAKRALAAANIAYSTRDVLIVNVLDEPGTLGDVALVMADAGINIDAVYCTLSGQVVLGVDDLDGAMQVAAGMAVVA